MCLFSLPIRHVSKTRIFARSAESTHAAGRQFLAYSMALDAAAPDGKLAMVLPIPVPPKAGEDAVTFIDMSAAKTFFDTIDAFFPMDITRGLAPQAMSLGFGAKSILKVHDVGDFEASFVPAREDFDRLDPRFRLSADIWDALPQYADWGFCVFKLRVPSESPVEAAAEPHGLVDRVVGLFKKPSPAITAPPRDFHPMAFEFPRRDPSQLFFPTVHVHDGAVHAKADFDHMLYCQHESPAVVDATDWQSATITPGAVAPAVASFLVLEQKLYRRTMIGSLPNRDVVV